MRYRDWLDLMSKDFCLEAEKGAKQTGKLGREYYLLMGQAIAYENARNHYDNRGYEDR